MTDKETPKLNLFMKIQTVKSKLLQANLKKSWENKHAWFKYYELWDFLPTIVELCKDNGLYTQVLFDNETATLLIIDCDDPTQIVQYTSPMRDVDLKWCQPIQALWAVETYQRRYLYLNAFDIVENDMLDAVAWDDNKQPKKAEVKKFSNEDLERLKAKTDYLKKFATSDDLPKDIQKFFSVDKDMKMKIADVRAEVPEDKPAE